MPHDFGDLITLLNICPYGSLGESSEDADEGACFSEGDVLASEVGVDSMREWLQISVRSLGELGRALGKRLEFGWSTGGTDWLDILERVLFPEMVVIPFSLKVLILQYSDKQQFGWIPITLH